MIKSECNFHLNQAAAALWLGLIFKIGLLDLKALFGCLVVKKRA